MKMKELRPNPSLLLYLANQNLPREERLLSSEMTVTIQIMVLRRNQHLQLQVYQNCLVLNQECPLKRRCLNLSLLLSLCLHKLQLSNCLVEIHPQFKKKARQQLSCKLVLTLHHLSARKGQLRLNLQHLWFRSKNQTLMLILRNFLSHKKRKSYLLNRPSKSSQLKVSSGSLQQVLQSRQQLQRKTIRLSQPSEELKEAELRPKNLLTMTKTSQHLKLLQFQTITNQIL